MDDCRAAQPCVWGWFGLGLVVTLCAASAFHAASTEMYTTPAGVATRGPQLVHQISGPVLQAHTMQQHPMARPVWVGTAQSGSSMSSRWPKGYPAAWDVGAMLAMFVSASIATYWWASGRRQDVAAASLSGVTIGGEQSGRSRKSGVTALHAAEGPQPTSEPLFPPSKQPKGNLKGKTVLITGASSGFGADFATHLALVGGANVVLTARRVDRLKDLAARIEADGGHALAVPLDVTRDEDFATAFQQAVERFGGLDAVVANAGAEGDMWTAQGLPSETSARKLMDINYHGVRRALSNALLVFRSQTGRGVFLVVSSVTSATRRGPTALADYCATKSALDALVRAAVTFAPEGVLAYGINPAVFKTELSEAASTSQAVQASGVNSLDDFASINPVFPGFAFPSSVLCPLIQRIIAGGPDLPFPPGSLICVDGPVAFSMHEMYKSVELAAPAPIDTSKFYDLDLEPMPLIPAQVQEMLRRYKNSRR